MPVMKKTNLPHQIISVCAAALCVLAKSLKGGAVFKAAVKNAFFTAACVFVFLFLIFPSSVFANNLRITNVTLDDRDAALNTAIVQFDISWENSWRNPTNHDAVWVFCKFNSGYNHMPLKNSGVDPADTSPGSNKDLEIYVPPDLMGAFIRRRSSGTGTALSSSVRLKMDYGATGIADTLSIVVQVYGIEMVFVPTGPFRAGDTSSSFTFKQGSSDTDPWYISSEATISVTNAASDGYYYTTGSGTYEDATGSTFTIPAAFPKGYQAFYCMKYEVTEGQWVDFINTLDSTQQTNRDITSATGKNSDSVIGRNTVSQSGSGTAAASTLRSDRAMSYLSWRDLVAYLDWAALRPMTELEFEKAARGPLSAVSGEYVWGSTGITQAITISTSPESGIETITTAGANTNYNTPTFSRGDDYLGAQYAAAGPLRVGIYATASSTRVTSGAGYYGAMELSGNQHERIVTVGNSAGRAFTGLHGDGYITVFDDIFNVGDANVPYWPHMDTRGTTVGVNDADGSGRRGGSAGTSNTSLMTSDRLVAAAIDTTRGAGSAGRGVRTYTGP